ATRAGSCDRKSTTPSSVTFWRRLSNSTQNGSASGSGKFVPKPTFWVTQSNGLDPSQPTTFAAPAGAAAARKTTRPRQAAPKHAFMRPGYPGPGVHTAGTLVGPVHPRVVIAMAVAVALAAGAVALV